MTGGDIFFTHQHTNTPNNQCKQEFNIMLASEHAHTQHTTPHTHTLHIETCMVKKVNTQLRNQRNRRHLWDTKLQQAERRFNRYQRTHTPHATTEGGWYNHVSAPTTPPRHPDATPHTPTTPAAKAHYTPPRTRTTAYTSVPRTIIIVDKAGHADAYNARLTRTTTHTPNATDKHTLQATQRPYNASNTQKPTHTHIATIGRHTGHVHASQSIKLAVHPATPDEADEELWRIALAKRTPVYVLDEIL